MKGIDYAWKIYKYCKNIFLRATTSHDVSNFFTLNESNQITKIIGFAEFSYTGNAYPSQKSHVKMINKKYNLKNFQSSLKFTFSLLIFIHYI